MDKLTSANLKIALQRLALDVEQEIVNGNKELWMLPAYIENNLENLHRDIIGLKATRKKQLEKEYQQSYR